MIFFAQGLIVPVNQTIWNATLKDFKIRGVPKEVSILLSITYKGGEYRTKGVIVIKLTKHEISPPKQFGVKVENNLIIKFEILGHDELQNYTCYYSY